MSDYVGVLVTRQEAEYLQALRIAAKEQQLLEDYSAAITLLELSGENDKLLQEYVSEAFALAEKRAARPAPEAPKEWTR